MQNDWIENVCSELQSGGYIVEMSPRIPGVQALLYARSPKRVRMGFAKVEDHLLFIDWENAAFGRLDQVKEMYRALSAVANQGFSTPHALRLQIPNLALVAVSTRGFPEDVVRFVRANNLNPWYGGETGQIILVQPGHGSVVSQVPVRTSRYPRSGDLPLSHAVDVVQAVCRKANQAIA